MSDSRESAARTAGHLGICQAQGGPGAHGRPRGHLGHMPGPKGTWGTCQAMSGRGLGAGAVSPSKMQK